MNIAAAVVTDPFTQHTFYHCIEMPDGRTTPGIASLRPYQQPVLDFIAETPLSGRRVLDIGCRDGLFSLACERRGAAVVGIDNDLSPAATRYILPAWCSKVQMRELNVYDLAPDDGPFDVVLFAGVLYHLRFPFLALKRIADAIPVGGVLAVETGMMLSPNAFPFVYTPAPEDSPWDPTSVTFFNPLALAAALTSLGFEDVQCRAVMLPNQTRFTWDAFLREDAASAPMTIGRGLYTARRRGHILMDDLTLPYWLGTHNLNSFKTR